MRAFLCVTENCCIIFKSIHASLKSHFKAMPTSQKSINSVAYINHSQLWIFARTPSPFEDMQHHQCMLENLRTAKTSLRDSDKLSCWLESNTTCTKTQYYCFVCMNKFVRSVQLWLLRTTMLQVLNRVTFKHISRWDYRFDFSPVPRVKRAKKCRYSSSGSPISHSRCVREFLVILQHKKRRNAVSARRHFFTFSRESFTFCLCN